MSKLKTNAIENVAGTHHQNIDDIGYPLSLSWGGKLLDETTTPKLSEVGIIGLNPIAYVYPDGTIVGESDNGTFIKHPNGELECRGNCTSTTSSTSVNTLPIVFIDPPILDGDFASSSLTVHLCKFSSISTNTFNVVLIEKSSGSSTHSYAATTIISYKAKGRWK